MASCVAALTTCEILEHIIAFMPPGKILPAKRVCRTWEKLINESTKISIASVLVPRPRNSWLGTFDKSPIYAASDEIQLPPYSSNGHAARLAFRAG